MRSCGNDRTRNRKEHIAPRGRRSGGFGADMIEAEAASRLIGSYELVACNSVRCMLMLPERQDQGREAQRVSLQPTHMGENTRPSIARVE